MKLLQDLDAVIAFKHQVSDALLAVKDDWSSIVPEHAAVLADIAPGKDGKAWNSYLDELGVPFDEVREPIGISGVNRTAFRAHCEMLEAHAKSRMVYEARRMLEEKSTREHRVAKALEYLLHATANSTKDLEGAWCFDLARGIMLGFWAGGAGAFPPGAERDLFCAARDLARDRANLLLEAIKGQEVPSDAVSLQEVRDIRAMLASYVEGKPDSDARAAEKIDVEVAAEVGVEARKVG